ncbi:MAG: ATP-binding protein [Sulfurovum sp.]|nr:ATP-binding protein [Sulfurovum sp.]
MQLKKVEIIKYRNFENVTIDFEKNDFPNVFSIASKNGGGKSTLLQFIFIVLHCFLKNDKAKYLLNMLDANVFDKTIKTHSIANFIISDNKEVYYFNLLYDVDGKITDFMIDTNMTVDIVEKLSNSIYLTVPDAQPLHFLSEKDDKEEMRKLLPNFSTYEFPTEKSILNSFEHEKQEDFREMRVHGRYGSNYIDFQNELKNFIEGKEIGENQEGTKITFKLKGSDKALLSEDLSHGELRKLGIYIWLKSMVQKDAIILMDEVDIALHPSWQYELVDDLTQWSKGSQFLLATHSPQILSSTYYKNLIFLNKEENKTVVKQPNEMFSDNDINTIINLGMDSTHIPPKLAKLQFEYRKLIENNQKDSDIAKELESQILEWETSDSAFFQRIKMHLRFNK